MTNEQFVGLVRHFLTTVGGILVAKGVLDETMLVAVAGGVATLVGAAWSIWVKRKPV